MSEIKRYFFFLLFVGFAQTAAGQAASSPFSTFGIGELYGNSLIQNQGMGGIGVSQPQFWGLNNQNPALLVYNYYTVFQAGALVESRTLSSDSLSQKNINGNLNYLVTAFPIKPGKWTSSVGIMPMTKVNYKLFYQQEVLENGTGNLVDTIDVQEQGSGGLTQVYWSNGVRLHEDWAAGIKAAYIFGSVVKDFSNSLTIPNQIDPFIVAVKQQTYVKDFMFSAGLSYSKDSIGKKNDYRISAGLVYNFSSNLNTNKTTFIQRRVSTGNPVTSDTLINNDGSVYIPQSITMGFSVSKGSKWAIGAEYTYQDWSEFRSVNDEDEGLVEAWKAALGAEFTPDPVSNNYLKRITFRTGGSYKRNPFMTNGKQLNEIGINFGFSLPTGRSSLDFAFEAGKRGDKKETLLEENFFKVYFGITFNDQWFIRRKFD
jgi:hypothetical protein